MAAYVVAPPSDPTSRRAGARLNIFPGSATPTVFAAGAPFWIGYGFVAEDGAEPAIDGCTAFELTVDGEPVVLQTDLRVENGRTTGAFSVGEFPAGLPAGWHRFSGRWYDGGVLVLTSDRSIEFVEA